MDGAVVRDGPSCVSLVRRHGGRPLETWKNKRAGWNARNTGTFVCPPTGIRHRKLLIHVMYSSTSRT